MRVRLFAFAGLVLVLSALVAVSPAAAGSEGSDGATACVLNTQLLPENEFRAPGATVDPTVESVAHGIAQIKVRNDGTIEWKVFISNPAAETFVAGHIHVGPPGANGPVIQGLFGGSSIDTTFQDSGEVSNPALATNLCATPAAYYVNYHTTQDPVGAVRGQLG